MRARSSSTSLATSRRWIGEQLSSLRQERRWSQDELATRLHVSQPHLSKVEHGEASLTAEQFLEVLKIFNVDAADFVRRQDPIADELQKALVRFGALHLQTNERVLPSKQLSAIHAVVLETLVSGEPRLVAALAPVLVKYAGQINFSKLSVDLDQLGLLRRLYWVMENTVAAIQSSHPDRSSRLAAQRLERALRISRGYEKLVADTLDPLDQTITTIKGETEVQRTSSEISKKWAIVTSLQPSDFASALREARGDS